MAPPPASHHHDHSMYNVTMNPPLPDATPFFPDWPVPPYTYVPGQTPHPIRDPAGHSYAATPEPAAPLTPDNWPHSRPYLRGFDLFNAGCYWEAHETWESCWVACGRTGTTADFLKGLIKLAAAAVKIRQQNANGARRHLHRADELFAAVHSTMPNATSYLGLPFEQLARAATALAAPPPPPLASASRPQPLLTFALAPKIPHAPQRTSPQRTSPPPHPPR